jgi:hypothetical protein
MSSILDHVEHPGAGAGLLVQLEHLMVGRLYAPVGAIGVPLGVPTTIHEVPGAEHRDVVAVPTP